MIERSATVVVPRLAYDGLRSHLFPGDGLEAAALLLCSYAEGRRRKLIVREVLSIPHSACPTRTAHSISWPGEFVEEALDRAEAKGLSIIAIHSHPEGGRRFSPTDDASDKLLMLALAQSRRQVCGSAIMTQDGRMRARLYGQAQELIPVDLVMVPGNDIDFYWDHEAERYAARRPMPFTSGMTEWLKGLSICIIGVSGTGSIVAEQLARLGVGEVILIDFDRIEPRNLNRILNSTLSDARKGILKVEAFAKAIRRYRKDCQILSVPYSIDEREAVLAAFEADVLFSCVDTAEARHLADRMAAYFAMPLFDVGVSIPTRRAGAGVSEIVEVCGRIDYVFPGGSTLRDREVYDPALLEAEYLARVDKGAHQKKVADGYIRGIGEQAPAVISLNMRAASACVMEFIARIFPFRHFASADRARTIFFLAEGDEDCTAEADFPRQVSHPIGAGLEEPLLGLPLLAAKKEVA